MENLVVSLETAKKLKVRFMKYVEVTIDCWLWTGGKNSEGYGTFYWDGSVKAHRAAYLLLVGPIPEGLQLDHLCRNRACVNPLHLEPVTNQVNAQRGEVGGKANAAKTQCPHGHKYTIENTYINKRGGRICRECKRASYRSWYGTKRSVA